MLIRLLMKVPKPALRAWKETAALDPKKLEDIPLPMLEGWLNDSNASVWKILENKFDKNQILTSLFCGTITEDKAEYILFDESAVKLAGLELKPSSGDTLDSRLNMSGSHHEILDLSGLKLCRLLITISNSGYQVECAQKKDLMAALLDANYRKTQKPLSIASTVAADPMVASAETRLAVPVQSETRKSLPTAATYETGSIGTRSSANMPVTPGAVSLPTE
jgi:hypothetical protein